jgi:hypothetical protein
MIESKEIKHILAEKIKFNLQQSISNEIVNQIDVKVYEDFIMNNLRIQLEWFALGREIKEEVIDYIYIPTSWFEHFKKALGMKKYKTKSIPISVKHWHICPHIRIPEFKNHVEFLQYDCGD